MTDVFLSVHAQRAMTARKVEFAEVEKAVKSPEVVYGSAPGYPERYRIHQRGELAVVVERRAIGFVAITVLWRRPEEWTDDEMAAAMNEKLP